LPPRRRTPRGSRRCAKASNSISICCRLAENWQSGKNRFNAPGEKLLGARQPPAGGVCGINSDPFSPAAGRAHSLYISERPSPGIGQQLLVSVITHSSAWFDFLNTHAPAQAWPFMKGLVFARCTMNRG
jgi:hypothetical protein